MKKLIKAKIAVSAAITIILAAASPFIIKWAYADRGYDAPGGEWFIPVAAVVSAMFMIEGIIQLRRLEKPQNTAATVKGQSKINQLKDNIE